MTVACDACGTSNRDNANFCIGCAAKLPGFAATGPSALQTLREREATSVAARFQRRADVVAPALAQDTAAFLRLLAGGGILMLAGFMAWYLHVTRTAEPETPRAQPEPVVLQPSFQQLAPFEPDLSQMPAVSSTARAAAARTASLATERRAGLAPETWLENARGATDTVARFYRALSLGDGATATSLVVASKRSQGPLSAEAMTAFYRSLRDPLAIRSIRQLNAQVIEARYTYRATRTACEGRALITMESSDPSAAIRSIAANC